MTVDPNPPWVPPVQTKVPRTVSSPSPVRVYLEGLGGRWHDSQRGRKSDWTRTMNLDQTQQQKVAEWIGEGLQPAAIQKRLADELGIRLTYMEVRFLLDDLKLKPKDKEIAPAPSLPLAAGPSAPAPTSIGAVPAAEPADLDEERQDGGVSVSVDQVTRPGAVVSGRVTFTDGKSAAWYLDQHGRLGLAPDEKGYKPAQADLMTFQAELQNELAKLGF